MRGEVNVGRRRYAVNLSLLFPEVPLLERPAAHAVEVIGVIDRVA